MHSSTVHTIVLVMFTGKRWIKHYGGKSFDESIHVLRFAAAWPYFLFILVMIKHLHSLRFRVWTHKSVFSLHTVLLQVFSMSKSHECTSITSNHQCDKIILNENFKKWAHWQCRLHFIAMGSYCQHLLRQKHFIRLLLQRAPSETQSQYSRTLPNNKAGPKKISYCCLLCRCIIDTVRKLNTASSKRGLWP